MGERVRGLGRGEAFEIEVDGEAVTAYPGETVAAVLVASGWTALRRTATGRPRGIFCGMGVCFDCVVTIDGRANVRSCATAVRRGMRVSLPGGPGRD
ncbi:MAG: (2Fe-2S)-binding protein [Chloroflexi bacterium]|nr:(2Fe-2S)-binding protein [Chloroflexota bacterium]